MVTINDIADKAGVSRTTVSRVLNESGYVSEDARKRVLRIIEETGYRPSEQAKSLRLKRTKVIGVVLPKLFTETSSRMANGLDDVFQQNGYQMLLASSNLDHEQERRQLQLLESRRVDGIILTATNRDDELLHTLRDIRVPVVALGQDLPEVSSVYFDDYHAAVELAEHMVQSGRSRIGFIGVDESDYAVGVLRRQGFLDTMNKHGLEVRPEWMQTADFTIECGRAAFEQMTTSTTELPDAVLAVTDRLAVGAMQAAKEKGLQVPQDIGFAGIGATDMSQYVTPALTTVDYKYEEAGREAAAMLLRSLKQPNVEKSRMGYGLLKRDSLSY
ncbi:LacI family DNA-binding transcriptional regulator [Alkalicoccus luteus]|uniref:LacI family transcriptional regulator n=1 Tax=Alkalicoccus luteus TaxID=1237094 RepID=A0A969TVT0_9BACI|nr:LacI family DNA-binding transcriptional regulator [Alkalicoccus luteus]NJP38725.1 LacI family transcriptional regulator [Alkalicoccus luteus]